MQCFYKKNNTHRVRPFFPVRIDKKNVSLEEFKWWKEWIEMGWNVNWILIKFKLRNHYLYIFLYLSNILQVYENEQKNRKEISSFSSKRMLCKLVANFCQKNSQRCSSLSFCITKHHKFSRMVFCLKIRAHAVPMH